MRQSAEQIDAFYATPLGRAALRLMSQRLMRLWSGLAQEDLLVLGTVPAGLELDWASCRRVADVDIHTHRPFPVDRRGRGNTRLPARSTRLPFADQTFSRVLLVHAIEESRDAHTLLREAWRVAAPEARMVVVASNRRGLWSRAERTPFGQGRPFTRRQLSELLGAAMFETTAWSHALYVPPVNLRLVAASAGAWERAGETLWPALGGVVLVEGVKRLTVPPGALEPARARLVKRPAIRVATTQAARDDEVDRQKTG